MTDEELFAELMEEEGGGKRATAVTAVHRVNVCVGCEFFSDSICKAGNFSVFRQAADEAGSCPEDKW